MWWKLIWNKFLIATVLYWKVLAWHASFLCAGNFFFFVELHSIMWVLACDLKWCSPNMGLPSHLLPVFMPVVKRTLCDLFTVNGYISLIAFSESELTAGRLANRIHQRWLPVPCGRRFLLLSFPPGSFVPLETPLLVGLLYVPLISSGRKANCYRSLFCNPISFALCLSSLELLVSISQCVYNGYISVCFLKANFFKKKTPMCLGTWWS